MCLGVIGIKMQRLMQLLNCFRDLSQIATRPSQDWRVRLNALARCGPLAAIRGLFTDFAMRLPKFSAAS